jgi:type IV pilus assembly protein PilY1
VDTDGNNQPNLTSEWDEDGDGEPDNYVRANSPENIVTGLTNAFESIVERVSAGTAAAVIADTVSFTGSVIQALYQPRLVTDTAAVEWVGLMHSVFIDQWGNLREDSDSDGQLDGDGSAAADDKIIQILYADDVSRTMLYYCTTSDNGVTATCPDRNTPSANRVELENLKSIWNVRDQLATIPDSLIDDQRDYDTAFDDASNGGRHIITWLDDDDGNVESGEIVDFDEDSFTNTNYGTLAAADQTEADNIVNWIRGKEISGYRNRTIDYDGDGTDEVWRLGDIVHSTPYVVSKPAGSIIGGRTLLWDVKYGDSTYSEFRNQYRNRRNVVIVGANDGMIHAFNAGFFDSNLKKYQLTRTQEAHETAAPVSHPLGAELWAYVPKNLQPQLKFLTQTDYPHVYYMDGKARVFDVNIFPDDTTHPKGWGTILVMGMRFGGGTKGTAINVSNDNDAAIEYQTTSAYVILDITDPEQPPQVLGEFADVDHGFTTSTPDLMVRREPQALTFSWEPADVARNDWYLVFGSGPTDLTSATSTQNAKLVTLKLDYDTTENALDMSSSNVVEIDTGIANSFVGDPATVDFTKRPINYNTDAIYFGISGGTAAAPTGQLMRVAITSDTTTDWQTASNRGALINPSVGQSFITRPYVKGITQFESDFVDMWVYAGTGRLYTNADNQSNQVQSLYGLRDRGTVANRDIPDTTMTLTTDSASATNLGLPNPPDNTHVQNVTDIVIEADGDVVIPAALVSEFPTGTDTYVELEAEMDKRSGWYLNLPVGGTASERNVTDSINFGGFQLFTTYMPSGDACTAEGEGFIYALDEKTGTAYPDLGLGGTPITAAKKSLGVGLPSEVTLFENLGGTRPIIQMSTGEIVDKFEIKKKPPPPYSTGRQSWREIFFF